MHKTTLRIHYPLISLIIIFNMSANKQVFLFFLFLAVSFAQSTTCPQLCTTNCSSGTCPNCYSSFLVNATISTCGCPMSMYLNSTDSLCYFCPITCVTCSTYSNCLSCIDGFIISNNHSCVVSNMTTGDWRSKNISYDLDPTGLANKIFNGF